MHQRSFLHILVKYVHPDISTLICEYLGVTPTVNKIENEDSTFFLGISSNDFNLFSVSEGGSNIKIWNFETCQILHDFHAHDKLIFCVCLSLNGEYIVSASMDHTLRIWNTKTKQLLQTLKGHKQRVICCSISPNNEFIVSGNFYLLS